MDMVGHYYCGVQFEQPAISEETSIENDVPCTRREHLSMVSRESHEIDFVQPLVVRKFAAIRVLALHSSEFTDVGGLLSVTTEHDWGRMLACARAGTPMPPKPLARKIPIPRIIRLTSR